jgi:hypothetical protein
MLRRIWTYASKNALIATLLGARRRHETETNALSVALASPSTGPAPIAVPNVVGQTQAAATTAITGAGLIAGMVTQQSSSTLASGDVISESPTAGTNVASGSKVNLVVSSGSSTGGSSSGSGGGGGAVDWLTLGALLSCLPSGLRRSMRGRFRVGRP